MGTLYILLNGGVSVSSSFPIAKCTNIDLFIMQRHPFDSSKWGRICQFLTAEGVLEKKHIVEPLESTKDDLLVVAATSLIETSLTLYW